MTLVEENPRFALGSLVNTRNRDWVVLPSDDPEMLRLRPLGGTDEDAVGVYLPLEGDDVRSATLAPPDAEYIGDASSAALLRDAARLGFRAAAGPLRSLGRVAFEPRPYQLVPLLMALRLEPVRLLIADDVGLGKSPEAGLIARELLDRGEIQRFCVLCPPHLCEQWQRELRDKFHVEAVLVRPGSVARLERDLDLSRSIFDEYPFTIVSIDYIKSDRRRDDFVRACPELIIIDEAHTVARPAAASGSQHQRHQLVAQLARMPSRHVVLTTATPHSGDEAAFASLVGLLDPELEDTVLRLDFGAGTATRERLSRHFVQRRRADVADFLGEKTPFPRRESGERTYRLGNEYQRLLTSVLGYARDVVQEARGLSTFRQRVHWWAALALLRCVSSSPAAASAALRTRAPAADEHDADPRAVDRLAAGLVLDVDAVDEATQDDSAPGVDAASTEGGEANAERRRLLDLARQADALRGRQDPKLAELSRIVDGLLDERFSPIVFCRYGATAHYVAEELRTRLGKNVEVRAVTGELPPEEREERVLELGAFDRRVLVATDCLSEGVNLQEHFNAVVHYDLAWNPTRHEQREGRVDRFNQQSPVVRTVMLYGQDNQVDGTVLQVLLRKADTIRKRLGVTVPVPVDGNKVLEAIFESLFLRRTTAASQMELDLGLAQAEQQVADAWDRAADREQRTRTIFAQFALNRADVNKELDATRAAIGDARTVEAFMREAAARLSAPMVAVGKGEPQAWELDTTRLPAAITARAELAPDPKRVLRVVFDLPAPDGTVHLARTNPLVEAVGGYLLDMALEDPSVSIAKRAGAIRTDAVAERTTVLVLRIRHLIHEASGPSPEPRPPMLAEEVALVGYRGTPEAPSWLAPDEVERLIRGARPVANVAPQQAATWLLGVQATLGTLGPHLEVIAQERAAAVLESHTRVRRAAGLRIRGRRVEPHLPPDVLGIYVMVPPPVVPSAGGR